MNSVEEESIFMLCNFDFKGNFKMSDRCELSEPSY